MKQESTRTNRVIQMRLECKPHPLDREITEAFQALLAARSARLYPKSAAKKPVSNPSERKGETT